jgi:hypothetical protein
LRCGKFSAFILLNNILFIPLAWTSSPSLPMICRFGLFRELLSSCILFYQLFSLLSKNSSYFSLISILSSIPEILCSTCSSLLEWLSIVFFIWVNELFISRISVWFFFWDFLNLC